jgi:adenylate cyclase
MEDLGSIPITNPKSKRLIMAIEIERKFLVHADKVPFPSEGSEIRQGYIFREDKGIVRIRTIDESAFITVKGKVTENGGSEFEYPIPVIDAHYMLSEFSEAEIQKTRYKIRDGWHTWEVDIFHGANKGLILAEVELAFVSEEVQIPDWVKEEVTGNKEYFNSNLAK